MYYRICIDSKSAIRTLSIVYMTFRMVKTSLNKRHSYLELIWSSGHSDSPRKFTADVLAKRDIHRWYCEPPCYIFRRVWLRILLAALSGHLTVDVHVRRLGLPYYDFCRSCRNKLKRKKWSITSVTALFSLSDIKAKFLARPFLEADSKI